MMDIAISATCFFILGFVMGLDALFIVNKKSSNKAHNIPKYSCQKKDEVSWFDIVHKGKRR